MQKEKSRGKYKLCNLMQYAAEGFDFELEPDLHLMLSEAIAAL